MIIERVKYLRDFLEGVAKENPITLSFMAVGFIVTWAVIIFTAVFSQ